MRDFKLGNTSSAAVSIDLLMVVLEECIAVAVYLAAGSEQEVVLIEGTRGQKTVYRWGRGDYGGRLGLLSLGAEIFSGKKDRQQEEAPLRAEI